MIPIIDRSRDSSPWPSNQPNRALCLRPGRSESRAVRQLFPHSHLDVDVDKEYSLLMLTGLDPAGLAGTVVGWGRTEEGGQLPAVIQEVQVPILTLAECRASKYRASRITPNMMCAGRGTQDSCQVRLAARDSVVAGQRPDQTPPRTWLG